MKIKVMSKQYPTSDFELNALLNELVSSVQTALADNLIGVYLQGSFAVGDWDIDSDVDFLIAINQEMSETQLSALQTMHGRIFDLKSNWAQHLEGSYFPQNILRKVRDQRTELWYLNNTSRELVWSKHDDTKVVRWVVREYGIALYGPPPNTLIDPVSADELRQEIVKKMQAWEQEIFADPEAVNNRWYQPYIVLSFCRMLHTLQTGRIWSKIAGANWAKEALDHSWKGLIQRAWDERPNPSLKSQQKADPADVKSTLDFVQYALLVATKPGT
jgi:predicted nucleotidyltransferase